jgi:hypothetical protein
MKKKICLSLFAVTSLFANSELEMVKQQLAQQQAIIAQLQATVEKLSKKDIKKQIQQEVVNEVKKQKSINTSASFSQNAYLPDIALILNMSTVGRDIKNSDYTNLAIPGFIKKGDMHLPFNKDRGFNLNYAELAIHSVVDPYFEAFAMFHLHPNEFEIGEAYVQTTALPYSLRVKAGKFKSNFGRINSKHEHGWHFDSQPIIYKALFGPDGISDPGIQVQYITPTDNYMMVGTEVLQGNNDRSFGDVEENNLYIGYIKSSIDIGDNLSILGGVSIAHGKNTTENTTDVYGVDLTLRDQLGSYSSLIWQSEFLQRNKDTGIKTDKQAGLYSEVIYQYNNNYSTGIRYDRITKNDTDLSAYSDAHNLDRYTAMVEYKPFPMSRLRLSYTYDQTKMLNNNRKNIGELMLSLNIATGAHGAHDY